MNQLIKKALLFFLLLSIGPFAKAGGGWPQPKGEGYFKLFQWWVIADQHYTDAGLIDPNITNGIFNTGLYAEYGFTNRLTGIAYFPFFSRAFFNNTISATTNEIITAGEAINSVGDTDLGLKYALIVNKPIALSATIKFGLPIGNSGGGLTGRLQTGDGEFNQLLQLDISTGFKIGKLNFYSSAYTGFNNRTNGFSDEFHFGLETGVSFLKNKLITIFRLYGIRSFKNGSSQELGNSTSIFADKSEHLSFSPEIAYQLNDRWGVSASYSTALSGKIIFAKPAYSVGVYFKLKK